VREVVVTPEDLATLDGRRVTTPFRTVVDLARSRTEFGSAEAAMVRALASLGGFGFAECHAAIEARRNLPAKRRALERLADALGPA
jgi:hypothetical protein